MLVKQGYWQIRRETAIPSAGVYGKNISLALKGQFGLQINLWFLQINVPFKETSQLGIMLNKMASTLLGQVEMCTIGILAKRLLQGQFLFQKEEEPAKSRLCGWVPLRELWGSGLAGGADDLGKPPLCKTRESGWHPQSLELQGDWWGSRQPSRGQQ